MIGGTSTVEVLTPTTPLVSLIGLWLKPEKVGLILMVDD